MDGKRLPDLIQKLYEIVEELEGMFPGRPFTPDGHMVGSLGECLAAYHYDLQLLPPSTVGQDAMKGKLAVEIKATQGSRIALRSEPVHLLVLKLRRPSEHVTPPYTQLFEEIYNGPGKPVWDLVRDRPRPSNGQYQVSLHRLKRLMKGIPESKCLKRQSIRHDN